MRHVTANIALILSLLFSILAGSANAQSLDGDLFAGLKARLVGPAGMSGRIAAIDSVADDPNIIVVGASTGGLWMSHNGGLNWKPVFDDQPVASIGAVAINQKNPDIIWVGTGEGNVRNSTSVGAGMYKSIDGGKTFTYIGLEKTERIHRIALHPDDPKIAYVAALGQLWSENAERGVYKTVDGGKTWTKILYVGPSTGATDIRMVTGNPDKLFAGMWEFRRWPYFFKSGGEGSGIYVSHDGGASWDQRTEEDGLPKGELGRSAFAIAPSNPNRVYALIEAEKSALARSDDGGRNWTLINEDPDINDRPFYYNDIAVDPKDQNRVYRIGSRVKLSIDGGKSFEFIEAINCCATSNTVHIDTHAWWINPNDPRHMIDGNDGGIAITRDHGETWRFVRNLPLAQFYHIAVDDAEPYNIYGGLQDNGSWRGPSEVLENGGIRNFHWEEVSFGDGFDTIPDPKRPNQGYSQSQGGSLFRWNMETGEVRFLQPQLPADGALADTPLRFNWNAGFAIDPFDSDTIYIGSQFVHKSTDRGLSWEVISADLTTNDPKVQTFTQSGGLTPDVTAAENYTTITIIAPSPIEQGTIWIGTDDGRIHVTRDGGQSWRSIENRLPANARGGWVAMIDPSPHDAGSAFITVDDHRRGDMAPHAFRVSNYGANLASITNSDVRGYAISIKQDPVDPNLLFLGTEFGLHVSLDGGRRWTKWTQGVPTVSVSDLAIQARESDLVVATHGRAAFVIDDYSALRSLGAADFGKRFAILSTGNGQQYTARQSASTRFPGNGEFRADNEPYGATITLIASGDDLPHPDDLKERTRKIEQREASSSDTGDDDEKEGDKPKRATITVSNGAGETVRTFTQIIHQGINRIVWDMRADGLRPLPPAEPAEDGMLPPGLEVLPGSYSATIEFDGNEQTAELNVLGDERGDYSLEAHQTNHEMQVRLQGMRARANQGLLQIIEARRDVETVSELASALKTSRGIQPDDEDNPLNMLTKSAGELKEKLKDAEKRFRVPEGTKGIVYSDDKVGSLIGSAQFYLASSRATPNQSAERALSRANDKLEESLTALNVVLTDDLSAFRQIVANAGLALLDQQPVE